MTEKRDMPFLACAALLLAAVPVFAGTEKASGFTFRSGNEKCRITWTGGKAGWRLISADAEGNFSSDGAVQRLSRFLDEAAPPDEAEFSVSRNPAGMVLSAPDGSRIEILADGSFTVFSSGGKAVTEVIGVRVGNGRTSVSGRLLKDEGVYGLGGRMDRVNQRGHKVEIWSCDGYNDHRYTYMPIPFFVSNRGGGVFVNLYERQTADFGKTVGDVWSFTVEKPTADVYFFAKDTIPEAISAGAGLWGHAAEPPAWSRGPVICRYSPDFIKFEGRVSREIRGTRYLGSGVKDILERHIAMGCPPSAVILEAGGFSDLYRSPEHRAEFMKILAYLKKKNVKPMVYIAMGVPHGVKAPGYRKEFSVDVTISQEGAGEGETGKLVPWLTGTGENIDVTAPGKIRHPLLDITDPAMWDWYVGTVWKELTDLGVRGVKIDFCEELPEDGVPYGGVTVRYRWRDPDVFRGTGVHHSYPAFFVSKFAKAMREMTGGDFMVLTRGGGIGMGRNPFMWAGDQVRSFAKLDCHVKAMINSGMSGVPFMTYDMAGYHYDGGVQPVPAGTLDGKTVYIRTGRKTSLAEEGAVFRRGMAFTAFSPCVQTHGDVRHVYELDTETRRHYVKYVRVHSALGPYLAKLAREAAETGAPPVRPLVWRWPERPELRDTEDAYLLGNALLVAPPRGMQTTRDVVLPPGNWKRISGIEIPVYADLDDPDGPSLLKTIENAAAEAFRQQNFRP